MGKITNLKIGDKVSYRGVPFMGEVVDLPNFNDNEKWCEVDFKGWVGGHRGSDSDREIRSRYFLHSSVLSKINQGTYFKSLNYKLFIGGKNV